MAKIQQRRRKQMPKSTISEAELPQKTNYVIMIAGVIVLLFGVLIMASGDAYSATAVTYAPIILFIAYCVIIPLGIMYKKKSSDSEPA